MPVAGRAVKIKVAGAGNISGTTDRNGAFGFTYVPPYRISNVDTISATCTGCTNTATKQIKVTGVGDTCPRDPGSGFGNPIEPASGTKRETVQDYADVAPHPLNFIRNYSSAGAAVLAGLGTHWSHNWAARLQLSATSAVVALGEGANVAFSRDAVDMPWRDDGGIDAMTSSASGTLYTRSADESGYLFDASGKLLSITQRNGWVIRLAYDGAGRLITLTNTFGRSIALAYTSSGLLASITPPDGQTINYGFDSTQRLTGVGYPNSTTQIYHYEDSRFPQALTGKTDEAGVRYATFSYDANGFATNTQNAGGANSYSFNYPAPSNSGGSGGLIASSTLDPAQYRSTVQVTDPLGNQQTWAYQGGAGQVRLLGASAAFEGGQVASRSFVPGTSLPETETDFLGVTTRTSWDTVRRLPLSVIQAFQLPEARSTQTEWHPSFRLPVRVTLQGRTRDYTYDALGNKLSETASIIINGDSARTTVWTYNPQGLIETITDPKGGVTRFGYDAQGNRTSARNALNQETRYEYDAGGRVIKETAPNGLVTVYAYEARGRLLGAVAGNESTAYTYTPSGQLASVSLPNGYSVNYSYDAAQRLIAATDNRANRISYTLDGAGNRIREEVKDPSGQIALFTSRSISQLNKVAAIQGASGQNTQLAYDANGEPISQTDPLNQTTRQTLDGLKRPTATTFADNSASFQEWNSLSELNVVTDPKGITTKYLRNSFGEVIRETNADISSIVYQRDALGDVVSSQDLGNPSQITRDALGRPLQVILSNPAYTSSHTTRYTWDTQQVGYLAQIEDNTGVTSYERDAQGRILSKTQTVNDSGSTSNPTVLTTHYQYVNGELARITYPSGLQIFYQRSTSGQITAIDTQEPTSNPRRPSAVTPFASGISYTALGQPKSWSWSNGDSAARSFDADGRMTSNEFASYTFDAASRISAISQSLWASRTVTSVVGTSTTIITELYRTPLAWTASYDSRNRLTGFKRPGNEASYSYDPNSNRLSAVEATTSDTDLDGAFDQDDFTQTNTQNTHIDPTSNRLLGFTQTISRVRGTRTLATTNANVNYTLDPIGNLVSDGLRTFEYDPANRLSKLKVLRDGEAASITYLHNALGQRVFKGEPIAAQTLPDAATLGEGFIDYLRRQFSWLFTRAQSNASIGTAYTYADASTGSAQAGLPQWAILGEYDNGSAAGRGRSEYIWLPTDDGSAVPVGMYRNGRFFAIHTDHLGTPRLMTNETNQPVWQWPYSAFGNNKPTGVLRATPNPRAAITNQPVLLRATNPTAVDLRFPGQHADEEAGQFYNYWRNYQASQGRYTQNDPIGLAGGLNRFGYVEGNALSFTDPDGLQRLPSRVEQHNRLNDPNAQF